MSYVQSGPQDQQDQQYNPDKSNVAGPVSVSGGAAGSGGQQGPTQLGSSGGVSGAGGAPSQPAPSSSGRFQNIQNYLKANAGYGGEGGLAGAVGQNLNSQATGIQSDIASQDPTKAIQQEAGTFDSSKIADFTQKALADPAKTAADADMMKQWQQYQQGTYAAPQQFDPNAQLQQRSQQFQQTAQLAGSEPGRATLLNNIYGSQGGYNTGQQSLDQLLLQADPTQLGNLQHTAQTIGGQPLTQYQQAQQSTQDAIKALGGAAQAGQNQLGTAIGAYDPTTGKYSGEIGKEEGTLTQKAADLQSQRQGQYDSALQQLQAGKLSPEMMSMLGIDPSQLGKTYGYDPTQALTSGVGTVGVGNVATADDSARFKGLAQLLGQPTSGSQVGDFANVAATPLAAAAQFDPANYKVGVGQAKGNYDAAYQGAHKDIANIEAIFPGLKSSGDPATDIANIQNALPSMGGSSSPMGQQAMQAINKLQGLNNIYNQTLSPLGAGQVLGPQAPAGGVR